jgi:hypothetical protein
MGTEAAQVFNQIPVRLLDGKIQSALKRIWVGFKEIEVS